MPKVTRQPDGGVSPLPEADARMVIASQQEQIRRQDALIVEAKGVIEAAWGCFIHRTPIRERANRFLREIAGK
jgi:hypothetical protein